MNNLYYALKQVFRLRWMNAVKIISLALGFAVSVALMCRMAWSHSHDNFWHEVENLQVLKQHYFWLNTENEQNDSRCFSAIAPEIASTFPSIEAATRFQYPSSRYYMVNEKQITLHTYFVDTSFFNVLKIRMIKGGNPNEILENRSQVIISQKTANMLFPDEEALGKELRRTNNTYIVGGICEDMPENRSFLPNTQIIIGADLPVIYDENDSFYTLFRTLPGTNLPKLEQEINALLEPRYKNFINDYGVKMSFHASNIHDFSKVLDIKAIIVAFALLLISGLNFALLSLSSLVSRAKEVGVRKAAGASSSGIFALIIWETVIYVSTAALLACVLFWSLQPEIEEMMGSYQNLFSFENLWAVGLVFVMLILIAGVLPAWIFARIPVTQVFQRFVSNRTYWKRIMLFIQFTASIFVISIMFFSLRQYQTLINHHYGYDKNNLVWVYLGSRDFTEIQLQTLVTEIGSDSRVEAVNVSNFVIWHTGFNGTKVAREPNASDHLYVQGFHTDTSFFSAHGIKILQGNNNITANFTTGGNIAVNQNLLDLFEIQGNPIGEVLYNENMAYTIVGVFQSFEALEEEVKPLIIFARDTSWYPYLIIRVNEVTADVVETIQEKLKEHYLNTFVPEVQVCSESILRNFERLRLDGKIAIFASVCLLLITVMGIIGYVNIEIRRRTKEIAVRRIHGSTAAGIIWKISRELLVVALLAASIAIPLAYLLGRRWQQDFVVKAPLDWYLFVGSAFVVVFIIALCTIIQTWRTANANPSKSIKLE
jgi:putative ABC transport system permease protein